MDHVLSELSTMTHPSWVALYDIAHSFIELDMAVVLVIRLGALSAAVRAWDLLKEITVIFITSNIVWLQVKKQGGNTSLPIDRRLD